MSHSIGIISLLAILSWVPLLLLSALFFAFGRRSTPLGLAVPGATGAALGLALLYIWPYLSEITSSVVAVCATVLALVILRRYGDPVFSAFALIFGLHAVVPFGPFGPVWDAELDAFWGMTLIYVWAVCGIPAIATALILIFKNRVPQRKG